MIDRVNKRLLVCIDLCVCQIWIHLESIVILRFHSASTVSSSAFQLIYSCREILLLTILSRRYSSCTNPFFVHYCIVSIVLYFIVNFSSRFCFRKIFLLLLKNRFSSHIILICRLYSNPSNLLKLLALLELILHQ